MHFEVEKLLLWYWNTSDVSQDVYILYCGENGLTVWVCNEKEAMWEKTGKKIVQHTLNLLLHYLFHLKVTFTTSLFSLQLRPIRKEVIL